MASICWASNHRGSTDMVAYWLVALRDEDVGPPENHAAQAQIGVKKYGGWAYRG